MSSVSSGEPRSESSSPSPLLTNDDDDDEEVVDEDRHERTIMSDEYVHDPEGSIFGPARSSALFESTTASDETLDQEPLSSSLVDNREDQDHFVSNEQLLPPSTMDDHDNRSRQTIPVSGSAHGLLEPTAVSTDLANNAMSETAEPWTTTTGNTAEPQRFLQLQQQTAMSDPPPTSTDWLSHLAAVAEATTTTPDFQPFPSNRLHPFGQGDPLPGQQHQQFISQYQQYLLQRQQQHPFQHQQQVLPCVLQQHPTTPAGLYPPNAIIHQLQQQLAAKLLSQQFPLGFTGGEGGTINFNNNVAAMAKSPSPVTGNHPFMPSLPTTAADSHFLSMTTRGIAHSLQGASTDTASLQRHLPPNISDATARLKGVNGVGSIEPFPEKLHRLLHEAEVAGRADVISFVTTDAFRIHKPNVFFAEMVPRYFRHSRLSSFKRQLNLYGFVLVAKGIAQGGYRHELFRKDEPALCRKIRRVAIKQAQQRSTTTASPPPDAEGFMAQEVDDALNELGEGTDLNDASTGSVEQTDFTFTAVTDNDHVSAALHDPSTMHGLDFES